MKAKLETLKWHLLIILGILFLSAFIFRQYIFDGYYFLSKIFMTDLLRANLPTYYQLYDSIASGGNFWSWKMGIGTSMFTHADVYFDPFTYIVFIFGRNFIPNMMIWLFVIKLLAEGLSFFSYISYFKIEKRACGIAAIIYAFSGYSLIMGNNFALGTILVYAPIIFLGIEKWLDTGKIKTLILGLFLTCIYSYYFFYVVGLLSAIYLCVRLHQRKEKLLQKLIKLAVIGFIVILLSAFSLLPQIELTLSSSRTGSGKDAVFGINLFIPQIKALVTAVIRSLSNDILGNINSTSYIGYSYEGHDFFQMSCYSSAFFIILITQLFHYEKDKIKHCILIFSIVAIITIFPIFPFIFNAFSTINARWMFMISILECLGIGFSIDSIIKNGGIHRASLLTGIILSDLIIFFGIILLSIDGSNTFLQLNIYMVLGYKYILAIIFLYIIFCVIIFLQNIRDKKNRTLSITILIIILLFIDEGINYYQCYGSKDSICKYSEADKTSYEDTSAKIVRDIKANDESLYRINKTFDSVYDDNGIPSENDAMVQGYFGLKNYNSLNNNNYITFLQKLGIYVALPSMQNYYKENKIPPEYVVGNTLNYIDGVGDRYHVMSYLGVKYCITNKKTTLPKFFKHKAKKNKSLLYYENLNAYPIAFSNKDIMSFEEFQTLSNNDKDYALLQYTIIDNIHTTNSILDKDEKKVSDYAQKKQSDFELLSFKEDRIKFNIHIEEDSKYLSTTIPYDKNWNIYIDGRKVKSCKLNIALLGAEITPGHHCIELRYIPRNFYLGILVSIISAFTVLFVYIIINRKKQTT